MIHQKIRLNRNENSKSSALVSKYNNNLEMSNYVMPTIQNIKSKFDFNVLTVNVSKI